MPTLRRLKLLFLLLVVAAIAPLGALSAAVQSAGPDDLIRAVVLEKEQVCPGEHFWIVVRAVHPDDPKWPVDVTIDGQSTSAKYLQFNGMPGPRLIHVMASTPEGQMESRLVEVEVIECETYEEQPIVRARINPYHPLTIDFVVINTAELGLSDPAYIWDFGDGQTAQTDVRYVSHYYGDRIDLDGLTTTFEAVLRIPRFDQESLVARKTVTIWNHYQFNKRRGMIQPRAETSQRLKKEGDQLVGEYVIKNLEDDPITISTTQLEFQYCDPKRNSTTETIDNLLDTIDGQEEIKDQIELAASDLTDEVCGVAYHLIGNTTSGIKAYVSLYFEVQPNPQMVNVVTDQAMIDLMNSIFEQGLVDDPDQITDEDLDRLVLEGKIDSDALVVAAGATTNASPSDDMLSSLDNVIGKHCDPENNTPPRDGISCQATDEWEWRKVPAYLPNAKKGDILLTAGCHSEIAVLLRSVYPPQIYTHEGIMTTNYYEVAHSTAAQDRYGDNLVKLDLGVFDVDVGIQPDVLKYGWSGPITQTIEHAYNGQDIPDPERDSYAYTIRGFGKDPFKCDDDGDFIMPLVVKPPPERDVEAREKLHRAADAAAQIVEYKGHYRQYAFTEGNISQDPNFNAPADPDKWWSETRPSVSTIFIWAALKDAGIELEGELELQDVLDGAVVDDFTPDGLYLYDEVERRAAGERLFAKVRNEALEKHWLAPFIDFLVEIPSGFGHQVVNCFASDFCDLGATRLEPWRNPGVGRSVSPDNFFFWDAPPIGVYGHNETVIYLPSSYRRVTIYRWAASPDTGTIKVVVNRNGSPVQFARVQVIGPGLEGYTDVNGTVEFVAVPAGNYEIEASKVLGTEFSSAGRNIVVEPGRTTEVTINLPPPRETGAITGRVYVNNSPANGATVKITGAEYRTTNTDASGHFTFNDLPTGNYYVVASATLDGLRSESKRISVKVEKNKAKYVRLNIWPEWRRELRVMGNIYIKDYDWPDPDDTGTYYFPLHGEDESKYRRYLDPWNRRPEPITIARCRDEVKAEVILRPWLSTDNTTVYVSVEANLYEDDGIIIIDPTNCHHGDKKQTKRFFYILRKEQPWTFQTIKLKKKDEGRSTINLTIVNSRRQD